MKFIKDFYKKIDKMESVTTVMAAPSIWYHTGSYALNKLLSGSFSKGIPQGRISVLAASSGGGKSLTACNIMREAQKDGAICVVLDSENALSEDFVKPLGVNTDPEKYIYLGVVTIQDVTAVLSEFINGYESEYGRDNVDAPKILIVLDSLDMLISDQESEKFDKGIQTSDMGSRTRLFKHMLRTVLARITRLNMTFLVTHQTYVNQDITNGLGEQIVNNAVRYSASQVAVMKPLKLKEGSDIIGIRIKAECYKSRFAQPGLKAEIEVPYASGMDEFSGVVDMLVDMKVIASGGAWLTLELPGEEPFKFQRKHLDKQLFDRILQHPIIKQHEMLFELAQEEPEAPIEN